MPNEFNKKYQAKHLAKIKAEQQKIKKGYLDAIEKIYQKATGIKLKGDTFRISDYPALSNEIDKQLLSFSSKVDITLHNGIKDQWELSIKKNVEIIHKKYGEKNVSEAVNKVLYDPQEKALEVFQARKVNGFTLSDRVLKYTGQMRGQIEQNVFAGLSEGRSAAAMARDQVAYMENPEPLFRRVRDAKGNLKLSKAAEKYYDDLGKPGRGVYRSPYKNFMRITRDTINSSYREADMVRYQSLPFVLGYKVSLSNNHPKFDVCDSLAGIYPKTFKWRAWHVLCMCNCVAELPSPEEYDKYEQAILNGTADGYKFKDEIKQVPDNLNSYIEKNKGMMDNWKRKPDWITENNLKI